MTERYEIVFVEGVGLEAKDCLDDIGRLMQLSGIRPVSGKLTAEMARLVAPTGEVFVAFSYFGDIEAWRAGIVRFARARCAQVARLSEGELILENGLSYPAGACRVDRLAA